MVIVVRPPPLPSLLLRRRGRRTEEGGRRGIWFFLFRPSPHSTSSSCLLVLLPRYCTKESLLLLLLLIRSQLFLLLPPPPVEGEGKKGKRKRDRTTSSTFFYTREEASCPRDRRREKTEGGGGEGHARTVTQRRRSTLLLLLSIQLRRRSIMEWMMHGPSSSREFFPPSPSSPPLCIARPCLREKALFSFALRNRLDRWPFAPLSARVFPRRLAVTLARRRRRPRSPFHRLSVPFHLSNTEARGGRRAELVVVVGGNVFERYVDGEAKKCVGKYSIGSTTLGRSNSTDAAWPCGPTHLQHLLNLGKSPLLDATPPAAEVRSLLQQWTAAGLAAHPSDSVTKSAER